MLKSAVRFVLLVSCFPLFSVQAGITRNWTGAVSTAFSEPNNWSPSGVPASDDSLVFPAATVNNDLLAGTAFGPMVFNGNVTLNGNAMTLMGDVTATYPATLTCNANVKIGTSLTLSNNQFYGGSVDVNGQTLTTHQLVSVKLLNGTGIVVVPDGFLGVWQGGTFAGTVMGDLYIGGAMPNANVVHVGAAWPSIFGTGMLGSVETGSISPGQSSGIGTLITKSINIHNDGTGRGAIFDLNATGTSDLIQVTGTVTLENPPLSVAILSGIPAAGQTFKLIDNDGSDPVSGTFSGLSEGATVTFGGYVFTISYHGGDGNDVVLTAAGTPSKTWNGSINALWSNAGNWTPNAIPVPGEPLVFPAGPTMTNDLPAGTAFGPLHFNGLTFLSGNLMTLTGDVTIATSALMCDADWKISAPLTLGDGHGGAHSGVIDVNGQTLTFSSPWYVKSLHGQGTVIVTPPLSLIHVQQDSSFAGTFMGGIIIGGAMPNANVVHVGAAWPFVIGNGTLGNVETERLSPGDQYNIGTLATKSIDIRDTGDGLGGVFFDMNAAGTSDLIQVTGTVTLESPTLIVTLYSGTPAFGQRFRIIDNDGTDPVSGTFAGLPEGAAVNVNGYAFRITYAGGDGNDVELVAAADSAASVSQGADSSLIGEPVMLLASITSASGTPGGAVTFLDSGVAIGTAPLSNGNAALTVANLSVGSHTITASYPGGGAFFGSVSGAITHNVAKGDTATSLSAVHTPLFFGSAEFRVSSAPRAPAGGTVSGSFTLREGAKVVGSGSVDAGSGHIILTALPVGTHTLVASYAGSASYNGSDSAPLIVEVTEAPTQVTAAVDEGEPKPDGMIALKVFVTPLTPASSILTGTVTISESGVVLSEQPATASQKVILTLPGGHHALTIRYSGDASFQSSSLDLDVDVKGTLSTRRRAVRH